MNIMMCDRCLRTSNETRVEQDAFLIPVEGFTGPDGIKQECLMKVDLCAACKHQIGQMAINKLTEADRRNLIHESIKWNSVKDFTITPL